MPLGKETGLDPGHIVLDGDPVGTQRSPHSSPSPLFGPCLLWPNGRPSQRLFILYTADLADVAAAHDVNIHSYADDTQLYLQCQRRDMTTTIQRLEICISDVSHWMVANRLKRTTDPSNLTKPVKAR